MSGTLPPIEPSASRPGLVGSLRGLGERLGLLRRLREKVAADEGRAVGEALSAVEEAASALQRSVHELTGSVRRMEAALAAHAARITELERQQGLIWGGIQEVRVWAQDLRAWRAGLTGERRGP